MMLRLCLAWILLALCLPAQAQDLLYLKGSNQPIKVYLTQNTDTDVYYTLPGDTSKIEYTLSKFKVDSIRLMTGRTLKLEHPLQARPGTSMAVRQVVKLDLLDLMTGAPHVSLEYPVAPARSVQLGFQYYGLFFPDKFTGIRVSPEFRFYRHRPDIKGPFGYYLAPYATWLYVNHLNGSAFDTPLLNYRIYAHYAGAGALVGRQVIKNELLVFNFYMGLGLLATVSQGTEDFNLPGQPEKASFYYQYLSLADNPLPWLDLRLGVKMGLARLIKR